MKRAVPLRLGIFGGTFDPVHLGHLLLARDALEQARLDAILFVPCARSPFKTRGAHVTDAQRVGLLRDALTAEPRFWLSRCELDRPAPSYSVDTAREIHAAFPQARLFWLIGHDQWEHLDEWRAAAALRRLVRFVRFPRGGAAAPRRAAGVMDLPRPRRVDISATEIRRRVKAGRPITHLVPDAVAARIRRYRLYQA